MLSKVTAIYPTGDFRRFNIKIFQHIKLLPWQISITKAKNYAMGEKNAEDLLIIWNMHYFMNTIYCCLGGISNITNDNQYNS
jgi:hypothetical protein